MSKYTYSSEICHYCKCTDFGCIPVNTGPHNLCYGEHCDEAQSNWKDAQNPDEPDSPSEIQQNDVTKMPTPIPIHDFMLFFNNPEEQEIQIYDLDTHDIVFQGQYKALTGYILDHWRAYGMLHSIDNLDPFNETVLVINCRLPKKPEQD